MTNPKLMKVSDEEREKATQQLSRALVSGRIDYADFEVRIEQVFAARNYIELGDVVVDLPVRAPTPPPSPPRYDYLPINAPRQPNIGEESSADEMDRRYRASLPVTLGMGLYAAIIVAAMAVGVRALVVDVLPSASPFEAAGVILIAVAAALFAFWSSVAIFVAVPRKNGRHRHPPPQIKS